MNIFVALWCVTTAIAVVSVFWADQREWQRRVLPWTAGILLGVGSFWILPEMARNWGWTSTLVGVLPMIAILWLIDRYVYPICPFCAAGAHSHQHEGHACRHSVRFSWPLLVFGCVHTLFDGWTMALPQLVSRSSFATALSWGASVHKIPESVAIGVLAAGLAPNRRTALAAVALIQVVMAAGGALAVFAGGLDPRWAELSAMPACAFLLLFGALTLRQEWQQRGRAQAMLAMAPGFVGCGLAAIASGILAR